MARYEQLDTVYTKNERRVAKKLAQLIVADTPLKINLGAVTVDLGTVEAQNLYSLEKNLDYINRGTAGISPLPEYIAKPMHERVSAAWLEIHHTNIAVNVLDGHLDWKSLSPVRIPVEIIEKYRSSLSPKEQPVLDNVIRKIEILEKYYNEEHDRPREFNYYGDIGW